MTRARVWALLVLGVWLTIVCWLLASSAGAGRSAASPGRVTLGVGSGDGVELAVDGRGDAVAVWARPAKGTLLFKIEAAYKPAGGAWQRSVTLGPAEGFSGDEVSATPEPAVAIGPRGDVAVAWLSTSEIAPSEVRVAVRPARGRWGKWAAVASRSGILSAEARERVALAVDARGDTTVVWGDFVGGGITQEAVYAAFRQAGRAWGPAVALSSLAGFASQPHVSFDQRGNAVAIWHRSAPGQSTQVAYRPARAQWGRELMIAPAPDPWTQLAVNPHGTAVVAWLAGQLVQVAVGSTGGGWRQPVTIGGGAEAGQEPQLALDPRGDAMIAWVAVRRHTHATKVRVLFKRSGRRWSKPEDLPVAAFPVPVGDVEGDVVHPRIALDRHGNALVAWSTPQGAYVAYKAAGRDWSKPIALCMNRCAATGVGFDSRGRATGVWTRWHGQRATVHALSFTLPTILGRSAF